MAILFPGIWGNLRGLWIGGLVADPEDGEQRRDREDWTAGSCRSLVVSTCLDSLMAGCY